MSSIIANSFTTYQLTDEEVLEGSVLTIGQREVLHNLLSINAEEKLALEYDVTNPETFIQQESYKKGWIDCIQHILDTSEAVIESRQSQTPEDQLY